MGKFLRHGECPACGSKDNFSWYLDDAGQEYGRCETPGCKHTVVTDSYRADAVMHTKSEPVWVDLPTMYTDDVRLTTSRSIAESTLETYNVGSDEDDSKVMLPYYSVTGVPLGWKERPTKHKKFYAHFAGDNSEHVGFFGMNKRGRRKLLVVEGELDALAAYQMLKGQMDVWSVPFGAKSLVPKLRQFVELIDSYDAVYVCMDNDSEGQTAAIAAMSFLDPGRGYNVVLSGAIGKDACDYLKAGHADDFRASVWGASVNGDAGFKNKAQLKADVIDRILHPDKYKGTSTGFDSLDKLIGGCRPGEIHLVISGTGVGKSSFVRQVAFQLAEQGENILYITLEDNAITTAQWFMSYVEGQRLVSGAGSELTEEQLADTFTAAMEHIELVDNVNYLDKDDVLKKIKYAKKRFGISHVFIDHVSALASGSAVPDREYLEWFWPNLKQQAEVQEVGVWVVSHISRDKDDKADTMPTLSRIKGSTASQQWAHDVMGLGKSDPKDRESSTVLRMLKANRTWSKYGEVAFEWNGVSLDDVDANIGTGYRDETTESEEADDNESAEREEVQERVRGEGDSPTPEAEPELRDNQADVHTSEDVHTRPEPVEARRYDDARGTEGALSEQRPDKVTRSSRKQPKQWDIPGFAPAVPELETDFTQWLKD